MVLGKRRYNIKYWMGMRSKWKSRELERFWVNIKLMEDKYLALKV